MQPSAHKAMNFSRGLLAGAVALAMLLAVPGLFAQEQDRPPASNSNGQDRPQDRPPDRPGDQAPPQDMIVPAKLNVPVGTILTVRTTGWLTTDHTKQGDTFTAVLEQPLIIDGWVIARRGQTVLGTVTVSDKGGRVRGTSQLGVEVTELTLVDGQQLPVHTQLLKVSAGTSHGQDAATIAGTTALGAAIGAAADWGRGAAIGAGAGAFAGILGVLSTRGRPTVIPAESLLTFRLQDATTISTERSQQAFQPVSEGDYGRGDEGRGRYGRYGRPGPSPYGPYGAYAAYPPCGTCGYYPYPYAYYPGYYYPGYFYPGPAFIGGFGFRFGFRGRGFRRW